MEKSPISSWRLVLDHVQGLTSNRPANLSQEQDFPIITELSQILSNLYKEKDENKMLQNQINQLKTNYSELEDEKLQSEKDLKQQLKTVQTQKDAEIEKLQNQITELLAEKSKLEVSSNAYVWKIEQHEREINVCHLQLQQARAEFNRCQERLTRHNLNTINTVVVNPPPDKKTDEVTVKVEDGPQSPQVMPPKDENKMLQNQINQLKTNYSELEDEKLQSENDLKQQLKTVQTQKDAEIEKLQMQQLQDSNERDVTTTAIDLTVNRSQQPVTLQYHHQHNSTEFPRCLRKKVFTSPPYQKRKVFTSPYHRHFNRRSSIVVLI